LDVVDNQHYITKWVEDNIIKGVRHTGIHDRNRDDVVKNVIDKGVKETSHVDVMGFFDNKMEDTLQNGIKETKTPNDGNLLSTFQWMEENNAKSVPRMINNVIENGVKSSFPRQYVGKDIIDRVIETHDDVYHHKGRIDSVIKNGVKETKSDASQNPMGKVTEVIKNGDKISGTFVGGKKQKENIESVIDYGIKNPSV
jgi:predicted peroxiredoxin